MTAVVGLLVEAVLLALVILLLLAMAIGVAVVIRPQLLERLEQASNRRYSMRRATRSLDIPRDVDRWFYRHHKVYGTVVVLLSIFLLSFVAFGNSQDAVVGLFEPRYRGVGAILVEFATLVMWLLSLFALLVGLVVLVRPSALRKFESSANRWLTPRRLTRGMGREYQSPGVWARRYPRSWGLAIAAVSAICAMALILHMPRIVEWLG